MIDLHTHVLAGLDDGAHFKSSVIVRRLRDRRFHVGTRETHRPGDRIPAEQQPHSRNSSPTRREAPPADDHEPAGTDPGLRRIDKETHQLVEISRGRTKSGTLPGGNLQRLDRSEG